MTAIEGARRGPTQYLRLENAADVAGQAFFPQSLQTVGGFEVGPSTLGAVLWIACGLDSPKACLGANWRSTLNSPGERTGAP